MYFIIFWIVVSFFLLFCLTLYARKGLYWMLSYDIKRGHGEKRRELLKSFIERNNGITVWELTNQIRAELDLQFFVLRLITHTLVCTAWLGWPLILILGDRDVSNPIEAYLVALSIFVYRGYKVILEERELAHVVYLSSACKDTPHPLISNYIEPRIPKIKTLQKKFYDLNIELVAIGMIVYLVTLLIYIF